MYLPESPSKQHPHNIITVSVIILIFALIRSPDVQDVIAPAIYNTTTTTQDMNHRGTTGTPSIEPPPFCSLPRPVNLTQTYPNRYAITSNSSMWCSGGGCSYLMSTSPKLPAHSPSTYSSVSASCDMMKNKTSQTTMITKPVSDEIGDLLPSL